MSVEDDDWATAVDIQEGLTNVEIKESAKQEGDDFTTVSLRIFLALKRFQSYGEDQVNQGDQSFLRKVLRQKLVATQSELEVQQRDPNSPLYSVRSFEELNLRPELLKGI